MSCTSHKNVTESLIGIVRVGIVWFAKLVLVLQILRPPDGHVDASQIDGTR